MYTAEIYRHGSIESLKKAIQYWTDRVEYMEDNKVYIRPNIKKHLKRLREIYNSRK